MIRLFIVLVAFLVATESYSKDRADNVEPRYILSGDLTLESYFKFQDYTKLHPELRELEFQNSTGSASDAIAVVNLFQLKIDEMKLNTYARGQCLSTCAFIFLMGHQRTLLKGSEFSPTELRLHPIAQTETKIYLTADTDKFIKLVSERSNSKITVELLKKMYELEDRNGGLIIKREARDGKYVFFQKKYGDKLQALTDASLSELNLLSAE